MPNTISTQFTDFNEYKDTKLEIELKPLLDNEIYISNLEEHILDYIKIELFIPESLNVKKSENTEIQESNNIINHKRVYYTKYFTEHIKIFENMHDTKYITNNNIENKKIIQIPLYYFNLNFLRKLKNQMNYIINVEIAIEDETNFIYIQ